MKQLNITSLYSLQAVSFFTAASVPPPPTEQILHNCTITPSTRDICIASPTGSGKTLAFALTILAKTASLQGSFIKALVISPTRDLAIQTHAVLSQLFPRVSLLVGQRSFALEQEALKSTDVVIATPGRLVDHLNLTFVDWSRLSVVVFDEVDRLLNDSFQDFVKLLEDKVSLGYKKLHPTEPSTSDNLFNSANFLKNLKFPTQSPLKVVCSATFIPRQSYISTLKLTNPLLITTEASKSHQFAVPKNLHESYYVVQTGVKPLVCELIVKSFLKESPSAQILIFCDSCENSHRLARYLQVAFGDQHNLISEFSSQLGQKKRNQTITKFRNNELSILIASDVISRGLDFSQVSLVLSYDAPSSTSTYVHRIGRTARADQSGDSVTLLSSRKVKSFLKMLHSLSNNVVKQKRVDDDIIEKEMSDYENKLTQLKTVLHEEAAKES
ncbi:hypothetical protein GEMRC1_004828 [Eukaryota sp. GEM-RC1]